MITKCALLGMIAINYVIALALLVWAVLIAFGVISR